MEVFLITFNVLKIPLKILIYKIKYLHKVIRRKKQYFSKYYHT